MLWNFSQPISDNMEEAVSGVKGELAIKIYGTDLKLLEATGDKIVKVMSGIPRRRRSWPVPRDRPAQSEFHGGSRRRPRATASTSPTCRTPSKPRSAAMPSPRCCMANGASISCRAIRRRIAIPRKRSRTSACSRPPASAFRWRSFAKVEVTDGASEIYREENYRYVAIKYSVRGRDLGSTVEEAMRKVDAQVKLPAGYSIDWAGEYASQQRSSEAPDDRAAGDHAADLHHSLHHVPFLQVGYADAGEHGHGAAGRAARACISPARTSACRRASAFWRSSACACRPA